VVFDSRSVVSASVEGVSLCPEAESQGFFPPQSPPDQNSCFREVHGLARVDANPLNNQLSQSFNNLDAQKGPVASEKLQAR
jgi:hypothetical protein